MLIRKWIKQLVVTVFILLTVPTVAADDGFSGLWRIDLDRSTAIDPWRGLDLQIDVNDSEVSIVRYYKAGSRVAEESMTLDMALDSQVVTVEGWLENRHIGAYLGDGNRQTVRAKWLDGGRTLQLEVQMLLETSQGETNVRVLRELRLSQDGKTLREFQLRSSRNLPTVCVFTKV